MITKCARKNKSEPREKQKVRRNTPNLFLYPAAQPQGGSESNLRLCTARIGESRALGGQEVLEAVLVDGLHVGLLGIIRNDFRSCQTRFKAPRYIAAKF